MELLEICDYCITDKEVDKYKKLCQPYCLNLNSTVSVKASGKAIFGFFIINEGCNCVVVLKRKDCKDDIVKRIYPQGFFAQADMPIAINRGEWEVSFEEITEADKQNLAVDCDGKALPTVCKLTVQKSMKLI